MYVHNARQGISRWSLSFFIGIVGVAAVSAGFADLAASGFGYVAWLTTFLGILLAGSRRVGWLLAGYFAYTTLSRFVAHGIMRKIPNVSRNESSAVGLVFIWSLLLMAGTVAVVRWYDLW
jgi:hypothetical protein